MLKRELHEMTTVYVVERATAHWAGQVLETPGDMFVSLLDGNTDINWLGTGSILAMKAVTQQTVHESKPVRKNSISPL